MSDLSYFEELLRRAMSSIPSCERLSELVAETLSERISARFPFVGSKIAWQKVPGWERLELRGLRSEAALVDTACRAFLQACERFHLDAEERLIFMGDSLTDSSYAFGRAESVSVMQAVLPIPQHSYFFPSTVNWCLVVSTEGFLDYARACFPETSARR